MKLYRAVARDNAPTPSTNHVRIETLRAPSNVPYLVDNLWEFLRPEHMPSRRHAAYASPTPELALANASSVAGADRSAYDAFEVKIQGKAKVAHLAVTDARYHNDIRQLPKAILDVLGKEFSALPLADRMAVGPLFMPYMRKADLLELAKGDARIQQCLDKAAQVSTFWSSAKVLPNPASAGELFFELDEGASYQLLALSKL